MSKFRTNIGGVRGETALQAVKPQLKAPRKYKVVLMNDDFTPMDFVVEILRDYFSMDQVKATKIMLQIHTQGKAVCGVFAKDIAETKACLVNKHSRQNSYPLLCNIEVT